MTVPIKTIAFILAWTTSGLLVFWLLYQLLPAVVCQINRQMGGAFKSRQPELDYSWLRLLPATWVEFLCLRLSLAGFRGRQAVAVYLTALTAPPVVFSLAAGLFRGSVIRLFLLGALLGVAVNGWVSFRSKKRQQAFQLCLYKIYRFLDLQVTAGVKPLDVLRGLPEVIDQPLIREDFLRFSARLELTLDLDVALEELQRSFSGPDMGLLASQLRNSFKTGVSGQTFQRMEQLLFNRHLSLIKAHSKRLRSELLLVSLLALVPLEILFLYPLAAQAIVSLGQLYGP